MAKRNSVATDVERIRMAADLASLVGRYGVKLRKSGVQRTGLCPFHKERTPSFYIHPGKQVYKCHGCGASGDIFTFIQKIEGVDFARALTIVAELTGTRAPTRAWTSNQRREYAQQHEDRVLREHHRMILGIPERESSRAAAAYRAACSADPNFREWLAGDLGHAQAITAVLVTILARAPGHAGAEEAL